jgi:transcriptional regulator with XRE-family HTH domain
MTVPSARASTLVTVGRGQVTTMRGARPNSQILLLIWQSGCMDDDLDQALGAVGPRLRALRQQRETTLADLSTATGISVSTLSRLETGQRKPSLELLLPLAQTYNVPLDELVGAPDAGDPRVHLKPRHVNGRTVIPLTRQPGGVQAWKIVIPTSKRQVELRSHEGYDWMYVISGKLRVVIGEHDLILGPGEVAEFDTRVPHWFGSTGEVPVEVLSILGRQGERMHVRAQPKGRTIPEH